MREIKFRAWDKQRKCWLGSFDTIQDNGEEVTIWDYIKIFSDEKLILSDVVYPVDIEQYTGLKDRNGKEIFEGDIVESESDMVNWSTGEKTGIKAPKERRVIRWNDSQGRFCYRDDSWVIHQHHLTEFYTVIGNIHENPELLHIS